MCTSLHGGMTVADKTKVSFYVPTPLARAIRLVAAREERSQSELASEALEAYLLEQQDHVEWLKAAEPAFVFWDNEIDGANDAL